MKLSGLLLNIMELDGPWASGAQTAKRFPLKELSSGVSFHTAAQEDEKLTIRRS